MRRARVTLLALALVALVALPSAVRAQTAPDDDVALGIKLYASRKYADAADTFGRAYSVAPKPETLFNLALAEMQAGRGARARRHFVEYAQTPGIPPDRERLIRETLLARVDATVGIVVFRLPSPTETYVLDDEAIQVVGDMDRSVTARLDPGRHHASFLSRDKRAAEVSFTVIAGIEAEVNVVYEVAKHETPPPAPRPPPSNTPRTATLWGLASASAASMVVSGVFFGLYVNERSNADSLRGQLKGTPTESACYAPLPEDVTTCASFQSAHDAYYAQRYRSAGFAIAGGVFALAAVATYFLWPKASPVRVGMGGVVGEF